MEGAFYHTLTFDPVSVSGVSNAVVEFDYHTIGFDNPRRNKFEVVFDNGTSWSTNGTALQEKHDCMDYRFNTNSNGTNHVRLKFKRNKMEATGLELTMQNKSCKRHFSFQYKQP